MAEPMTVELVAADRVVWSGEATTVIARTTEGELGILANHAPTLGVLVAGAVEVQTADDERLTAVVDRGFLSVANNRISILAEHAQLSDEIDVEQARRDLESAQQADADDDDRDHQIRLAETKIRVAERAG